MSTITKKWLQQKIAGMEATRDEIPFGLDEDDSNTLAALRIALASLEADPVAWIVHARTGDQLTTDGGYVANAEGILGLHSTPLFATPLAPVSVPEPIKRNDADGWWMYKGRRVGGGCAEWYNRALDDCRATMFQSFGNSEQLNSPVIPDGYALVPVEPTYQMCKAMGLQWESPRFPDRYRAMIAAAPHFREIVNSSTNNFRENAETSTKCWCRTCRPITLTDMRFVVCPNCGNKRCPHANDHRNACTGSNEPGQEGSAYPAEPQRVK